jgi:hypothetical protein
MIGNDVFPSTQFQPTVRNSLHDLRGEAAVVAVRGLSNPPEGASEVGWRAYSIENGPASTGLACGTCNSTYARPSSAQMTPMGANTPRSSNSYYRTPVAKLRAAFYL